jgi:hypothetical protein
MQLTQALRGIVLPLLAAVALVAQTAPQPQPVTKISFYKVPLDKTDAFIAKGKLWLPTLDALIADGTVLAYGMERDYLHTPGHPNVVFWFTTPNFAALEKADKAMAAFEAKNPQLLADIIAMNDANAHQDKIVRSPVMNMKPSSACMPKFAHMRMEKVKAGKVQDDVALFRKYLKAEMDALVDSGVICAYGYDVESIHGSAPGLTGHWTMLPDLGSMDRVRAATGASWQKLAASDRRLIEAFEEANHDATAHRDMLTVVEAYKSK